MTAVELHPDMHALVSAKEALENTKDPDVLRREWNNYGVRLSRPYPDSLAVEDQTFDCPGAGREGTLKVRVYRPSAVPAGPLPCVIFLHGGGFVKGSLDSGDSNAWGVADQTDAVVISIDYRLAPEFPYPAALTDAYEALRYVAAHADSLGIDRRRIALWGESAGANLAAGVALRARDEAGPPIAAQILIYGPFDDEFASESYQVHATSVPGITTAGILESWPLYTGGLPPAERPYSTPLKIEDLRGLPPAFVHYAEVDPLADDSPRFATRLSAAGVPTTLRCARGMIHGFLRARFSGSTAANEFSLPCMYLRGVFASGRQG